MDTSRCGRVKRMRAPNLFNTAVQTNKHHPTKTRTKKKRFKLFDGMFDGLQFFSKHDQTRSNTTNQGGQTVKCLVIKQCSMVFSRQTFPVLDSRV